MYTPSRQWWGGKTRGIFNKISLNLFLVQCHSRPTLTGGLRKAPFCVGVCMHIHIGMQTPLTSYWCLNLDLRVTRVDYTPHTICYRGWLFLRVSHCPETSWIVFWFYCGGTQFVQTTTNKKPLPQDTACQLVLQTLFYQESSLPVVISCHQCSTVCIFLCWLIPATDHDG